MIIFCDQKDSEMPYLITRPAHKQIETHYILLAATLQLKLKTCTKPKIALKKVYCIYKPKEIIKNIHTKMETALLRQQVMNNNDVNECCELLKQVTTIAEEKVPLLPKKDKKVG